ncbi:hypothetical protein BC826DRAFT_734668 [Russula brevipes]|nr:hypothetical protein BC826DRAFT_734668 [Russula brevipes]
MTSMTHYAHHMLARAQPAWARLRMQKMLNSASSDWRRAVACDPHEVYHNHRCFRLRLRDRSPIGIGIGGGNLNAPMHASAYQQLADRAPVIAQNLNSDTRLGVPWCCSPARPEPGGRLRRSIASHRVAPRHVAEERMVPSGVPRPEGERFR